MKREDLVALGLTEEQIEKVIAENSKDIQSEKAKTDKYKADADKAKDLQSQLDTLQNQNLTDSEKLQKQIEALQQQNADLTANSFRAEAKAILKAAKLEDADIEALLPGIIAGLDKVEDVQARTNAYVSAMNKVRDNAIKEHDKEVLDGTNTPGGAGGAGDKAKTEDVKMAEDIAKTFNSGSETSKSVFENY